MSPAYPRRKDDVRSAQTQPLARLGEAVRQGLEKAVKAVKDFVEALVPAAPNGGQAWVPVPVRVRPSVPSRRRR